MRCFAVTRGAAAADRVLVLAPLLPCWFAGLLFAGAWLRYHDTTGPPSRSGFYSTDPPRHGFYRILSVPGERAGGGGDGPGGPRSRTK